MIILSKKEVYGVIYVIENKINGKKYVGQTVQSLKRRFQQHTSTYSKSTHLARAISKYGKDNFSIKQIDVGTSAHELNSKEVFWIKSLDSRKQGYNIAHGGRGFGFSFKDLPLETQERIRKVRSKRWSGKNNPNYGNNSKLSLSTRDKMSVSRGINKNPFFKKEHPVSTIDAIVEASRVEVINLDTLDVFSSIISAGRVSGCQPSAISKCCKEKQKTTKGMRWAYYDDYISGNLPEVVKNEPRALFEKRAIINLDTKEEFESAYAIQKKYGYDSSGITKACKGKQSTSHGYSWAYLEDYLSGSCQPPDKKLSRNPRAVINIDTGKIYKTISDASNDNAAAGASLKGLANGISSVCRGKRLRAGGYRWQYYEDYLKERGLEDG